MRTTRLISYVSLILLTTLLLAPAVAGATARTATLTVTNTADSGPGTLRQALADAGRGDTIDFDPAVFPPAAPAAITLLTPLPQLVQGYVTIDGHDAGVIIDGSSTPTDTVGIDIVSDGNILRGLHVLHFPTDGIRISGGAQLNVIGGDTPADRNIISGNSDAGVSILGENATQNQIAGNYIGSDATGKTARPNGFGVAISEGASNNVIGGNSAGERNVISGNNFHGIGIYSASDNQVTGNYIGVDVTGMLALGNGLHGVRLAYGATENEIGGEVVGQRNVIAGNGRDGVVIAKAGTDENIIAGNYIGIGSDGSTAIPNGEHGVEITEEAESNVVGGATDGERNVISGNTSSGVRISGEGADRNRISGNYIGLDATGATALPNGEHGVEITDGGWTNVVGGPMSGEGNVIAGNSHNGVLIAGDQTDQNWVCGNYIGADAAGSNAVPNGEQGVLITEGAQWNVVGGVEATTRNIISGNSDDGVRLSMSGTSDNVVSGNYIGTNLAGVAALPNGGHGVQILQGASNTRVGGLMDHERNVISGNGRYGIRLAGDGTDDTVIQGNYIGLDVSGLAALGNSGDGVIVTGGAVGTQIGGSAAGARNVISGNGCLGIGISESGTRDTVVNGNIIGLIAPGTAPLPNGCEGVLVGEGAEDSIIGGDTAGDRNVIAGNGSNGVTITDPGTVNTVVSGNYIGLNAGVPVPLGNGDAGVRVRNSATDSQILFNVIGHNASEGVLIQGEGTDGHLVAGNFIGTDADGIYALPNDMGIRIEEGAQHNTIGGATPSQRNLISGNAGGGILIQGNATRHNHVLGNVIGANASEQALGNGGSGIDFMAPQNVIGGLATGEGNSIVANNGAGITLVGTEAYSCTVQGNRIGLTMENALPLGNQYEGIAIQGGAHDNLIGGLLAGAGNTIWHNLDVGVLVHDSDSIGNRIARNSITANAGQGIDTANGGNIELSPPVIVATEIHLAASSTVTGTACANCTVEVFTDAQDEGRNYQGSVVADAGGQFIFYGHIADAYLTATATDASGNSSEFSAPFAFTPPCGYLPLLGRAY